MNWFKRNQKATATAKTMKVEVSMTQIPAVECDTCHHIVGRGSAQEVPHYWRDGEKLWFCKEHQVPGCGVVYGSDYDGRNRSFFARFAIDPTTGIPVGYAPIKAKKP
ncbi:MAG: hypothetical protein RLY20_2484 [Verrucomicrobiota bacterium]